MDDDQFVTFGKKVLEIIRDIRGNIQERPVISKMVEGYLVHELPDSPPHEPEDFNKVLEDFQKIIVPGMTHWNHPQFYAYFPSGDSYSSVLADTLTTAFANICFSWMSNPVATELETIMLDWTAKAFGLPACFRTDYEKDQFKGGGVIQGSASECTLVSTFAARARAIKRLRDVDNDTDTPDSVYLPQLVAYASAEAHSSVQKATVMSLLRLRILDTDEYGRLDPLVLKHAMIADKLKGLTPCLVVATVGTTGMCAFDDLQGIAAVIKEIEPEAWFHVDGAYGGNLFILPAMREYARGLEHADSFNVNPNKMLLCAFDTSLHWIKDVDEFTKGLAVHPCYLRNDYEHKRQIDYRHYGVPLSRRFRALKLWFLFRAHGITGLRNYVSNIIAKTKFLEEKIKMDRRFEICNIVSAGLITFTYRETTKLTRKEANDRAKNLIGLCNKSGEIHVIPTMFKAKHCIRISVNYSKVTDELITECWNIIKKYADQIDSVPTRKMPARFTFTRSVSKEVYERQSSMPGLMDGATPILVMDNEDIIRDLQKATLKNSIRTLNEEPNEDVSN